MTEKRGKTKRRVRYLGTYTLAGGKCAGGDLSLNGANTSLKLHSREFLPPVEKGSCIRGTAYSGECLTLIDCYSAGTSHRTLNGVPAQYHVDVFPHFVAIGNCHVEPDQRCVTGIHFTTTDLTSIFHDIDAFGSVLASKAIIDTVLQEERQHRSVEAGEYPVILYFTGKDCIAQVPTALGKISVHHRPRYQLRGPRGVSMKDRIVVSIETDSPVNFSEAVSNMYDLSCFLSMAAGRTQGIDHIQITTNECVGGFPRVCAVYPSFQWKVSGTGERNKPDFRDVPLDPINDRAEFDRVLTDWIGRHSTWRVARLRYLECLRKANKYGAERLVAAANMFDILPSNSVPMSNTLSDEIAATRDECVDLFRRHPPGIERNSALSSLGRLGQPSLPKKVAWRASIVELKLGSKFPDLQLVVTIAVKCRNFFVHGDSDDIDFLKMEPLVPFLTDALEFVFAASDFIDAGWNPTQWSSAGHGWGHTFARFYWQYDSALEELRRANAK
jgi:hypothetical protein